MTIKVGFEINEKKGSSKKKVVECVGDKAYRNFTRVLLRHFSGLVILVKHRSLYYKRDDAAAFWLDYQNLQRNPKPYKSRWITFQNEQFGIFIVLLEEGLSKTNAKLSQ